MNAPHPLHIVWFKRDLRLQDHAPLKSALENGDSVLLLYIWEPSLLRDPHYAARHWRFVGESLRCLDEQLKQYDTQIRQLAGEVVPILQEIRQKYPIAALYSHEETGLKITYDRDKEVADFCQTAGIAWHEYQHNGVQRGLPNRKTWKEDWHTYMNAPIPQPALPRLMYDAARIELSHETADWENLPDLPAEISGSREFQPGGEEAAHRYLSSFFQKRATDYSRTISKPEASRRGSGRLSPYLAWGNLSVRMVFQRYKQALREELIPRRNLIAFGSRLRWHCHFIQKFESEDRIEFENVNRAYDAQVKVFDKDLFRAWAEGHTGFPLVDACMRCLHETGHLNFRMRAMLVSFLTHLLWQPWKPGAVHLATLFLDFEPGIHYAQFQMQTGVTGVNTVRIYNPVKQSYDHDPEGTFIKKWVPELAACPPAFLHEPWKMTAMEQEMYNFHIGVDYPEPIVAITEAHRTARERVWAFRKLPEVKKEGERILKRHVVPGRRQRW
ncbi:FAD-binding domain-containing protein [Persicitalea jodogahamensis]|uniref:Cryptochrome-like protein cry2 n=1 Tax=Persicitalea jodogahamensis TaxID=402147 RepID=A0A8J3D1P4_9BACT|nr:deoxyribodipyrimidine photo-lyase [Persicitalea jodogahamensis]GHB54163.1 cryptochrome-like protein cry2 [Persicitalea jodogahamensis]